MLENNELFVNYAPVLMLVLLFFTQSKIFVTSRELEKLHREVLDEAQNRFAPLYLVNEFKNQMIEIKEKIDKIYDFFLNSQ